MKILTRLSMMALGLFALISTAQAEVVYEERVLGDPNAPITMIEYASFTCPHCADFHNEIFPQIKKDFIDTGKVKFIFRDFPFDRAGATAAMLARCVAPSQFNGFVGVLMKQQQQWATSSNPLAALTNLGRLAGLSQDKIDACFKNEKLLDQIILIRKEAMEVHGINSTPSFLINGEKVESNGEYERFKNILESKL